MKYLHVFIPIYFTLGAVLLFLLISSLIENQNTKETKHNYSTLIKIILYGIGIIFISSAIVTLQVKLDYTKDIKNHYIEVIVGMIGYIFICINNILNMFCSDYINEEENGD